MPVSTRAPACPWNAHGISYLTDEDIYDNPRTGHPTHTFFPVPWTKTYDVTLPPRPCPLLPFFLIPPLSFPYFIRGNFVVFSFFFLFLFSFSNERVGRIEISSLSSEKEERNFRYRRVWNGSKRTIVISFMLIREGYTILSFRLVLLEF